MAYEDISESGDELTCARVMNFTAGVKYGDVPGAFVPNGGIIAYSGLIASIAAPWYFCDGTNGTPDLVDKMILGCTDDDDMGDTGGADTHTHGGGTLAAANASAGTPAGTIAWPAGVPTFSGDALGTHDHDYSDIIDHVHGLDTSLQIRNSATGTEASVVNGITDTSSTLSTGFVTDAPVGAVATGTTTADSAGTPAGTIAWPVGVPTFTGSALADHNHSLSGDTASASSLPPYVKLGWIMLILPS